MASGRLLDPRAKKGRNTMTTQTTMKIVSTSYFNGHQLNIYGSEQEPRFLARDIAEMIDYSKASLNKFMQSVDDDEKERKNVPTLGGIQKAWFLTEQGLYEVLFQSRKPKAQEFKKWVKQVLKEIRLNGYYMQGKLLHQPQQPTDDLGYLKSKMIDLYNSASTLEELHEGLHQINNVLIALHNARVTLVVPED